MRNEAFRSPLTTWISSSTLSGLNSLRNHARASRSTGSSGFPKVARANYCGWHNLGSWVRAGDMNSAAFSCGAFRRHDRSGGRGTFSMLDTGPRQLHGEAWSGGNQPAHQRMINRRLNDRASCIAQRRPRRKETPEEEGGNFLRLLLEMANIRVHRFHKTNMLRRDSHDATLYGMATPGQPDR